MNFFNRYVLGYALVVFITTVLFYFTLDFLIGAKIAWAIILLAITYGVVLFLSALFIGKRDIYEGYYGLNYNLTTYLICNSICLVLILTGLIDHDQIYGFYSMAISWGIGVVIHFFIYLVLRKRSVRGFDKKEIFD